MIRRALIVFSVFLATGATPNVWRQRPAGLVFGTDWTGGRTTDATGKAGTLTNGATISGKTLSTDGVNDHLLVPDSADLSFGNAGTDAPFTVSCWCKLSSYSSTAIYTLVSKGEPSKYEWGLYLNSGATPTFGPGMLLYNPAASIALGRKYSTRASSTTAWQLISATYSGSKTAGGIKLYLNGSQVDDSTISAGSYAGMTNGTGKLSIGIELPAASPFPGLIGTTKIYNRELSQAEIQQETNRGLAAIANGGTP